MPNSASEPTKPEDIARDGRWMSLHERFVAEAKEKEPDVILLGDSLLAYLSGTEIWDTKFAPLHCLNFSIGGDTTSNILWRCINGELDNMKPQVIVLCVGTNNHQNTAEEVCEGILTIAEFAKEKQPRAHLIVVSIPPRGRQPCSVRDKIQQINSLLAAALPADGRTHFLKIDPSVFINPSDGTISHMDMFDYLHFTKAGYSKFCKPILEEIKKYLHDYVEPEPAGNL